MMVSQAILLFSKGSPQYADVSPADQDCYRHTSSDLGEAHGHPTEKMVAHCHAVLRHLVGGSIYDPFLGSGTTIIAAEMTGRVCYGLEIDPKYCDVIVQRWENFTGKKAERPNAE